ncbi:hypothetical protein GCM10027067_26520 [Pseudactinotalea suaedae]
MAVTNDETTGRTGTCVHCGHALEEALLLKGLMVRDRPGQPEYPSPGRPTWRRLDRGPGSARCPASPTQWHDPGPQPGAAFGL